MKRCFFLLAMLAIMIASSAASELTSEQKAFQSSIMTFLREEGFMPSIDEDNSLTFKKEGILYWIDIAENSPFYIEFHRNGLKCEDANMQSVLQACNMANRKVKCVKSIMGETSVTLVIEMYCHSDEEFKYIFYKSIKDLDLAYSAVKDYYSDMSDSSSSSSPFQMTSCEIANTDKDGNIITNYGENIYSFESKYLTPKISVNVKTSGTYEIYVKVYNPSGTLTTGTNSPSGYSYKQSISMTSGEHKYTMTGWGSNTAGHWSSGNYRFEFYYNGSIIGQKSFSIK